MAAVPTCLSSPKETEIEWCERRLLARIHRLTVGMLRKQIEPVTAAQFMRWLMRWQHVAPGSQVAGERGAWKCCSSCRDSKSRRMRGSGKSWRGALRITIRSGWISFA